MIYTIIVRVQHEENTRALCWNFSSLAGLLHSPCSLDFTFCSATDFFFHTGSLPLFSFLNGDKSRLPTNPRANADEQASVDAQRHCVRQNLYLIFFFFLVLATKKTAPRTRSDELFLNVASLFKQIKRENGALNDKEVTSTPN